LLSQPAVSRALQRARSMPWGHVKCKSIANPEIFWSNFGAI